MSKRIAVVTGASKGIGAAIAIQLASYINGETILVDGGLINVDYVLKKEAAN